MEGLMICIFVIILLVCIIAIFSATVYNKFQEYIIKINEVESMIDNYLRNKYDLINRCIPIVKSNIDSDKEVFGEIVKLRSRKKYLDELIELYDTPDIKVITGIRRSGKSVLLQEFITYLKSLNEQINIVMINLQELEFDYLLEYHALHKCY